MQNPQFNNILLLPFYVWPKNYGFNIPKPFIWFTLSCLHPIIILRHIMLWDEYFYMFLCVWDYFSLYQSLTSWFVWVSFKSIKFLQNKGLFLCRLIGHNQVHLFKIKILKNMNYYIFMISRLMFIGWLNYVASYDICSRTKDIPLLSFKEKLPFLISS